MHSHNRFWGKDLQTYFPQLSKHNDPSFCPSWGQFVQEKWPSFQQQWQHILTTQQMKIGQNVVERFNEIQVNRYFGIGLIFLGLEVIDNLTKQNRLSTQPLTLCHGDVKSPNIFFKGSEPYFIDWQYIVAGKGVQVHVILICLIPRISYS